MCGLSQGQRRQEAAGARKCSSGGFREHLAGSGKGRGEGKGGGSEKQRRATKDRWPVFEAESGAGCEASVGRWLASRSPGGPWLRTYGALALGRPLGTAGVWTGRCAVICSMQRSR